MTAPFPALEPSDRAPGPASFALAAEEIVDRLVTSAEPGPYGPSWHGRDVAAAGDSYVIADGPVGDDVYGGRAGIAWVIAQSPTGGDLALAAAHGAVDATLATPSETMDLGLFTGATGIAAVADDIGRRLGDDTLVADARRLGLEVAHAACEAGPLVEPDLMHGRAGTLLGLLALFGLDEPAVAAACRGLGDALVAAVDTLELCGYSHGGSGVARALEELALATGEERYLEAVDAAVRYERTWFSPMHGWPDLRGAADGSPRSYPAFWCHGAVGIGLARLASFARRADLLALAEASAAIGFARNSVMAMVSEPAAPLDSSLCHGVAGAAELFLVAWEVTGTPEHLAAARRTGGLMMARARAAGGHFGSGLIDRSETPGLFVGLAGVAATLFRLHDPAASPSAAMFPWPGRPMGGS